MDISIKSIISTVAPWIATALAGPLAGQATTAICNALGVNSDTSDSSAVNAAIAAATPDQMLALKTADTEFAASMQALGFKNIEALAKIAADDRDSARKREIATRDLTPRIIAAVIVAGYFIMTLYVFTYTIPEEMRDFAMRSMGTLDAALALVLGYYFGSSNQQKGQ